MFDEKKDRLNYSELIKPPLDYEFECAVGTTYSLDFETMASFVLSMAMSVQMDSTLKNSPIGMFSAMKKMQGRILVYCEAGQIHMPDKPNDMHLLLEQMISQVALRGKKNEMYYPSFHPKMWFIVYSSKVHHKRRYRLIVSSRNIAASNDWDNAIAIDGEESDSADKRTVPLTDFLSYLRETMPYEDAYFERKAALMRRCIRESKKVCFHLEDSGFDDLEIIPVGISKTLNPNLDAMLHTQVFDELVVFSPFLSADVIADWNDVRRGKNRILFTRDESLAKLKPGQADRFKCYELHPNIIDPGSETTDSVQGEDIHAKMYLVRTGEDTDFYLGSMNASRKAYARNVELLVRLRTNKSKLNGRMFLRELFNGKEDNSKNPFINVQPGMQPEADQLDDKSDLERALKTVCRMNGHAVVQKRNDRYCIHLTFDTNDSTENIMVSTLHGSQRQQLKKTMSFENLDLLDVSEFYLVHAGDEKRYIERIIMIPTDNIPQSRDNAVTRRILSDADSLMAYLSLSLDHDPVLAEIETAGNRNAVTDGTAGSSEISAALYEKMLKASVDNPEDIRQIDKVISEVDLNKVMPPEFKQMYQIFLKTVSRQ